MNEQVNIEQLTAYEYYKELRESFKNKDEEFSYLLQTSELLTEEEINSLHSEFNIAVYDIEENYNFIEME